MSSRVRSALLAALAGSDSYPTLFLPWSASSPISQHWTSLGNFRAEDARVLQDFLVLAARDFRGTMTEWDA